jgi:hypothetical protein
MLGHSPHVSLPIRRFEENKTEKERDFDMILCSVDHNANLGATSG